MRLLQRPRTAGYVAVVPRRAAIRERVFGPGPEHDLDPFLEPRLGRVAIKPMLEIITRHAAAQAYVQAPARQDVEHRALFSEPHRIVERQDIDEVSEPQ